MKAKSRLKIIREERNITLSEVAKYANIGISRYFMIESGERPASPELAESIATYFKMPICDIFLPNSFTVREDDVINKPTGTTG